MPAIPHRGVVRLAGSCPPRLGVDDVLDDLVGVGRDVLWLTG